MPFHQGSVSYARFAVSGGPTAIDSEVLEQIANHAIRPTSVGVPAETEFGWVGPRHIYDNDFSPENIGYDRRLLLAIRIDTNKIPAEVSRAYRALAEQNRAAESPTGFLSRAEKRIAKEEADERCRAELTEGRYRRSKLLPILWDLETGIIYAPAFTDKAVSAIGACVSDTFDGATVRPLTSGALAYDIASRNGLTRDYEDARPSPFTAPPAGATSDDGRSLTIPPVPWSHGGPEPSDFLGNEFLFFLWSQVARDAGSFDSPAGHIHLTLDRALDLACAWDATGTTAIRADHPTRLPETTAAVRSGKWPRKVGMLMSVGDDPFEFTIQADRFNISSLKLPKVEDAQTPRDETLARLEALAIFDQAMAGLFEQFILARLSNGWATHRDRIKSTLTGVSSPPPDRPAPPVIEVKPQPALTPSEADISS